MLYFLKFRCPNFAMEYTYTDLRLAFEAWEQLDRSANALGHEAHHAQVQQAWKCYCSIRDELLNLKELETEKLSQYARRKWIESKCK